jgi:hypothetical protein
VRIPVSVIVTCNLVIVAEVCCTSVPLSLCGDCARGVGHAIDGLLYRPKCLVNSRGLYVPR